MLQNYFCYQYVVFCKIICAIMLSGKKILSGICSSALAYLFVHVMLISCSTNPVNQIELEPGWNRDALAGTEITLIEPDGRNLLIGTEDGLFLRTERGVKRLGLKGRGILGVVRLDANTILAGGPDSPTIMRSNNDGKSWSSYVNNFGGSIELQTVNDFSSLRLFSDTLFAVGTAGGVTAQSNNRGQSWELVTGRWDNFGGLANFVKSDSFYSGRIWTGGVGAFSQPYLILSEDYGGTWEAFDSLKKIDSVIVEAITYDVMTHPQQPDWILAGMGGAVTLANNVRKSIDGGQSWQLSLEATGVHAFARSARNPERIYASGRDGSGKLFFVATTDFGEKWEKNIFDESPVPIIVNDLGVMTIEGNEVLFLGTDQGLYSYRFE